MPANFQSPFTYILINYLLNTNHSPRIDLYLAMGPISLSVDNGNGALYIPGRKEDCESTPLLAHHDGNLEVNYPRVFRRQLLLPERRYNFSSIRQFLSWLLKHLMTLALSCLFVGGIVAAVIYIGGAFYRAFHLDLF